MLSVTARRLTPEELAALQRAAEDALVPEREREARASRQNGWIGLAVLAIFAALWIATFRLNLDRTRSLVSTAASAAVCGGAWFADRRLAASRRRRIEDLWRQEIDACAAGPVVVFEVRAGRCWGSPEQGWLFDAGDGRALLVDWDFPGGRPPASFRARAAAAHTWIDLLGESVTPEPLDFDWDSLPETHPLLRSWPPVVFALDPADPAAAIRAMHDPWFPRENPPAA